MMMMAMISPGIWSSYWLMPEGNTCRRQIRSGVDDTRSPHQTTLAVTTAVETRVQIVPTHPSSNEILTRELAVNEHKVSV